MDLAAHDAPRCRRNSASERGIRRNSWLRVANGLVFYLAPTIIFFIVAAIGLWGLPGDFWGIYGNDDGLWVAWNVRGILEWSRPFDLAPFNPLSGMIRSFFPIPSIRRTHLQLRCAPSASCDGHHKNVGLLRNHHRHGVECVGGNQAHARGGFLSAGAS
jgi:hypothetical protein